MTFYLRIVSENNLTDIPLQDNTILGDAGNPIPGGSGVYHFFAAEDGFMVSSEAGSQVLKEGQTIRFGEQTMGLLIQQEDAPVVTMSVDQVAQFRVGRGNDNDLVLPSRADVASDRVNVSRNHALFERSIGGWIVSPLKIEAKLYVNGKIVKKETQVGDEDLVQIGKYTMVLSASSVSVYIMPNDRVKRQKEKQLENESRALPTDRSKKTDSLPEPPSFNRGPHIKTAIPEVEIKLPVQDRVGDKPEFNWVSTLLPPMAMLAIMLGIFFFTGNAMSLMYTVPMYCVTMVVSFISFRSQRKKFKKKKLASEEAYRQQLEHITGEINDAKTKHLSILEKEYPTLDDCFAIVQSRDARLWRIRPEEDLFLDLRLGIGPVRTHIKVQGDPTPENEPIVQDASRLEKAPVSCPVPSYMSVGVVGNRQETEEQLKRLVIQAAVNHAPDELKIVFFLTETDTKGWSWVKWLPHVWDNDKKKRYLAADYAGVKRLSREFDAILSHRSNQGSQPESNLYYLFVFSDSETLRSTDLMKYLPVLNRNHRCSFILPAASRDFLPDGCRAIVEIGNDSYAQWYSTDDDSVRHKFKCDWISEQVYDSLARMMAPIHIAETSGKKGLPSVMTFLNGYGVSSVDELNIGRRWEQARPEKSLSVPVGVRENGDTFFFDIHEKAHGPHGMASGRAGSGKSEMVQSWILSLALNFRPDQVSFVIVDFKGTGLLNPFRKLPHVAGTISNLDHNSERNVVALQREMNRRMEVFKRHGVSDITSFYQKLGNGEAQDSFPFLIVVVDEYADLKKEHPEFSPAIDRIYTLGRSLGIYIITLAQDAASAASDMIQANSRFRWCMQVATSDASRGMLETTDAYTMPHAPGRGFVKVGDFEVYEQIQSFWSGAPFHNPDDKEAEKDITISQVSIDGTRIPLEEPVSSAAKGSTEKEIAKVVEYIDQYTIRHQIPRATQIWQPPMPETIALDDVLSNTFDGKTWPDSNELELIAGLVDDPNRQRQYPLAFTMNRTGHISVQGSPESGKTTFLLSATLSLCERYDPDTVQLYLFDYDKWALNLVRNLPHVMGSSAAAEPDEIKAYIAQIHDEMATRKSLFLQAGAISHEGYCTIAEKIPAIFIIVDNIAAAWEDNPDLASLLEEVAAKGAGYGIYLIVSAPGNLPYRIQNSFRTKLSLYQLDRSEYVSIVGRSDITPENYAGRGLVKLDYPVEFQTALPVQGETESERNQTIHEIVESMRAVWKKDTVSELTDLARQEGHLLLGRDPLKQTVFFYENAQKHSLTVSCESKDIRKDFVRSLTRQLLALEGEVILFDQMNALLRDYSQQATHYYAVGDPQGDQYLSELMPILQERYEGRDSLKADSFTPIYLIIAEFGEFFESVGDDSITFLKDIVTLGDGLNVHLFVFSDRQAIRSLGQAGEKLTHALLRENHAILLGASFDSHFIFTADLSVQEQAREFPENEGWYLLDGKAKRICQAAAEEDDL